jgi:hypothetical protein
MFTNVVRLQAAQARYGPMILSGTFAPFWPIVASRLRIIHQRGNLIPEINRGIIGAFPPWCRHAPFGQTPSTVGFPASFITLFMVEISFIGFFRSGDTPISTAFNIAGYPCRRVFVGQK